MHSNFNLDGFRGRRVVKIVSILLLQTFLFYNVGFAMPGGALPEPSKQIESREISIENIGVSKDIGSVKTKYKGKNGKLIIHIQDAHCNYEAQTNISKILENFSKGYDINLVSVEGADGYIDTSWFKAFPDAEIRKEVADYFMKKGEITGAEFLSITTDYPIKLYGAENRDLYIKNLNAFTTTYPYKEEIEKHLSDIKTVLNRLKGYIYTKALKDFDGQIEKYKTKDLTLSEYAKILKENIKEHKLNINDYPDYAKLVYTLVYEDKIDFKTVDQERATLIDTLSRALTKEKLQDLVTKSFSFRVGKVTAAEYYTYLKELSVENGIDLTKEYPNLANYVIYTRLYERIDNERLFEELDVIKNTIKEKLFKNDDQRKLSASWDNVNILLGLINIKLSNKEYDYYKAHKDEVKPEFFINFIRSKVGMYNLSYKFDDPSETLIEHLSELEKFYEIAAKRDRALVDNTIKTMGDEKKDTAILITGGFHTEGIKHALEEKGYSYIVVCPNITKDVESPYIQVLTNQKTPFEELLVESAAPAREDNLLGPFVLAKLTHLSKKELRDLDRRITRVKKRYAARQVGSLEERIDNVTGNWVRKYVSLYIDKVRKEGYTPEKDSDLLENVFLLAYKDRVREVFEQPQRGSYEDETGEAENLIREEFARLRSGTAGRGPMRMAKENALLTKEEALAANHPIRQVIEQAQEAETKGKKEDAAKLWNKILVGDNMYFDVLDDLALDRAIVEYNWNPDNPVRVPLDLECHPGTRDTKGVYYETGDFSKVEVHAYLRRSVYNVLTPAERETLVRHERMHIRIALRNAMVPDSFEGTEEDYVNLQEGCDVRPILKKIKNMRQMNFCQNAEKLIGESLESRPPNPDLLALAIAFGIEARIGLGDKTALPRLLSHIYGWRGYKKQLVDNAVEEAFKTLNRKYPLLAKKWLPEALQGQDIILPARAFFEKNLEIWLRPKEVSPEGVQAVIIAGGGGTRLWPLSTSGTPKQLLSLVGGKPLVEIAVMRLMRSDMPARNIYIQTNPAFKDKIFELVKEHGIKKSQIFTEPQMADTAAAIGYAVTKLIEAKKGDVPTFFVTADHIIGEESKSVGITFRDSYLKMAAACKESPLVGTIGINPLVWGRPSSDFGHINVGDETFVKNIYSLGRFVEKPRPADAAHLFSESERILGQGRHVGAYLFNSGMFIATPEVFLRAFQRLSPAYYNGFKRIMDATAPEKGAVEEQVFSEFAEWKKQKTFPHPTKKPKGVSFDFAVAEPLGDNETPDVGILVIPGGFPWTDIGSFKAIFEHCQEHREPDFDDRGNLVLVPENVTVKGQETCKRCLIFVGNEMSEKEKGIKITLDLNGLEDSIVIYNPKTKACLIAPMDVKGSDVKYINAALEEKGERWMHYLTGEDDNVPKRTTIFRAEKELDTRLFSTQTGRVIQKNTSDSRLYSDYGLLAVIGMSNLLVLQHKHTGENEIDISIDAGKGEWRKSAKDRANGLKALHINRVRQLTSSQRTQTLLKETIPSALTLQTYANMFGLDIEGDYKTITDEINEIKRAIKARNAHEKFCRETFTQAKIGTSGVRGDAEKILTDMEIYINFKAQALYAMDLAKNPNLPKGPLYDFIRKGVISIGDIIVLAADFRPSSPRILVAIAVAFIDAGFKIDYEGLIPTPALAYCAMEKGKAGFMVTGSHTPYRQNGGKTYWSTGELLKPEEPILRPYVEKVRKEEYWKTDEESMFTREGAFKNENELNEAQRALLNKARQEILKDTLKPVDTNNLKEIKTIKGIDGQMMSEAEDMYIRRNVEAFGDYIKGKEKPFKGKKVVFYAQSAVGRKTIPIILKALGAEVIYEEPAEDFIQIDTENFDKPLVEGKPGSIKDKMRKLAKKNKADFVITIDGDSDRPVFSDENGEILYGDKLGVLASLFLGLEFVACPITANKKAVKLMRDRGIKVVLAKVGSPYVIEAMLEEGFRKGGLKKRGGFEVNGGFILGTDIELPNGKILKALPTRDAALPLICAMLFAIQENKSASQLIKEIFSGEYESYGFAGLVSSVEGEVTPGCESYTIETGLGIVKSLSPQDETIKEVDFGKETDARMSEVREKLEAYLGKIKGLEGVGIERINYLDGAAIYLSNGEIVHLRPSGNAAQFRIYTEAKTQDRAIEMVKEATKPKTGVLVTVIQDFIKVRSEGKNLDLGKEIQKTTGRGPMRTGAHESPAAKPDIGEIIKAIKINEIEEAVTNFFAYAQKLELPTTGLGLISNELIEYYGGLKRAQSDILEQTRSNIENFLKAVISEAVHEKNVDTARGLEIMSTQVLNIISWIDRGVSGAEGMRVTSNIKDMVQAEDKERGPSYIDKATLPVKPTGIEGTPGFYYRGAERPDTKYNLDELKDTAFADYREESERTVMYAMDHGFIEVPSSLMEMTKKGQISAMHETTFINGMMPNSARYADTGKGHWQGKYLDIKQVTKGRVLQLIDIYDGMGNINETLVHVVNEGEFTRAIPGSVDYMIPLTDVVMFNDIRVEVPGDLISEFNPHIKDALDLELIEEAVSKKGQAGYKLIDFKGKPVLVKVDAAGPDVTSWITYPEQAKLKNLISFYRGTTPGEIENLIKDLAVARPHYLKEAPMHVMDLQEKSELPEYLRALGELDSIIVKGKPIKFVLEFRTGREGYVWGEPVRVSSILELLGAKTESEKIRLAGELGIPEDTVISERWITAGAIELGPGYMRLPLEVLALWGKDVFGIQHLAQFGSETGINAKQLTSARPLSLQIHTFPEMFIALEDGYAYLGLSRDVTKEEFIEALRKGDETILNRMEIKKGQSVIVPAGMPHAYGTVRIYEVKAVTAAQDKAWTRSLYDRLRLSESQKQEVAGIQREYRVVQEAASLLVAKELVREGKDVLTLASEEVEKTVDIIERHGYLNKVDLAETEFMPILVSNVKTEDRARFEIIGFTEAFVVGRYTINPGQSIESNELTHGKPHSIFVTEGKVGIFDETGDLINLIAKGNERMIPASIGKYELMAIETTEPIVVYTQFKPLGNELLIINAYVPSKETLTGIISGKSIFEDRHKIILTEKGTTVERIEIKTGEFILKQSPGKTHAVLTLEVGDTVEVTDESGRKLAQLEKGKPVPVTSSGNLIFKSKGAAVVKIMYPETKEEKAVFTTVEVLRRNLETIRQRLGEAATPEKPKGIQILQSNDLAGSLYTSGDKNTEGHIRNEEKRLSRYLGIEVKITRRATWEKLLEAVDTEKYIPVVMSTDEEMRDLLDRSDAKDILPELSGLHILPPIDSSVLSSLSLGEGWLYTRELEGLAILLATIKPEDITEKTQIVQDFLLVVNSMVDKAKRITDISRLSLMLPGQKEAVEDIRARFNDLINAILLTMPARPFDKDNDIYRKREVLYSV